MATMETEDVKNDQYIHLKTDHVDFGSRFQPIPRKPERKKNIFSDSEDDKYRYKMNQKSRGTAIIINNRKFEGMPFRNGSDVDLGAMYDLFSEDMEFTSIAVKNDLAVKEMIQEMELCARRDHSNMSCFVCVILSHGEEGYVYGTDGKVLLETLVEPFKGDRCLSLAGKPKLFFIQACRGTKLDYGIDVSDAIGVEDEEEMSMENEMEVRRIPAEADFLFAYSVVPGYFAWRNSRNGSWFIQAVKEVFSKNWKKMDVVRMLTRVNHKVAYEFESCTDIPGMHRKKQTPCITSMLTKDLYFG